MHGPAVDAVAAGRRAVIGLAEDRRAEFADGLVAAAGQVRVHVLGAFGGETRGQAGDALAGAGGVEAVQHAGVLLQQLDQLPAPGLVVDQRLGHLAHGALGVVAVLHAPPALECFGSHGARIRAAVHAHAHRPRQGRLGGRDLGDGRHQVVHPQALVAHGRHHRHAQGFGEARGVDLQVAVPGHVGHVQHHHQGQADLQQFGGQVEVPLEVGRVQHVHHHVGRAVQQVVPGNQFLLREGGQAVGPGQVHQFHVQATALAGALLPLHGHARVIAHPLARTREVVEDGGLARVGIAGHGHVQGADGGAGGFCHDKTSGGKKAGLRPAEPGVIASRLPCARPCPVR